MENKENEKIENKIDVNNLELFEVGQPIEVEQHEGKRAKIEKIEIIDTFHSYNDNGMWEEGLKIPCKKMKVYSEVLDEIVVPGKDNIQIRASMRFSLKENKDAKTGVSKWGFSNSPQSKLYQFMKKMKVNIPKELIGKFITVTVRPSGVEGDDRRFLGFAI